MTLEGTEYHESNSFPKNFSRISNYISDKFDCPGLYIENAFENEFPEHPDPITHIVDYYLWMGDPSDKLERERTESLDEEELEEERLRLQEMHIQMLHDLDMLVRRMPEFADYQGIIERSGIGFGLDEMRSADLSDVDAVVILAMMIYIYRSDRFCGYQEHFQECMQDGTFKRWLVRLAEIINYPAW